MPNANDKQKLTASSCVTHEKHDNPFWQFSLAVYKNKEVETLCLQLQDDYQIEVNTLLFSIWLATQGRKFDASLLTQNPRLLDWQINIISSLRKTRLSIAQHEKNHPLYQEVKSLELAAEQEIQCILWQMTNEFTLQANFDKEQVQSSLKNTNTINDLIKLNIDSFWNHMTKAEMIRQDNLLKINPPAPLIHFCEWMISYSTGKIHE